MAIVHAGFMYSDNGEWHLAHRPTAGIDSAVVRHEGLARDASLQAYVKFGDPAAGDYVFQGQRYTADGAAYVTTSAFATGDFVHDGFRRDSVGRLYITNGPFASSDFVHAGIRRTVEGAVYVAGTVLKDYIETLTPDAWFRHNVGVAVSQWDDQSGNGRHLVQGTATAQPSIAADGALLFDGVDNAMKCTAFTLNQPETVYLLMKQVTWTGNDRICDGNTNGTGAVQQNTSTPGIAIVAGLGAAQNTNLAIDTYGVVAAVFNGASSVLQVNNTTPATGNAGANNMGGFTLGSGGGGTLFSNIQVKEVIIFPVAHDADTRRRVIRYLAGVGSLSI